MKYQRRGSNVRDGDWVLPTAVKFCQDGLHPPLSLDNHLLYPPLTSSGKCSPDTIGVRASLAFLTSPLERTLPRRCVPFDILCAWNWWLRDDVGAVLRGAVTEFG